MSTNGGGNGSYWSVVLGGVLISGGSNAPGSMGSLTEPPDGLGHPGLRTQDVAFPGRDGVRHGADYYEGRIITLAVMVCNDACEGCDDSGLDLSARTKLRAILGAWNRKCGDVELTLFPDCYDYEDPDPDTVAENGPYAVIGRPRVADLTWLRSDVGCAMLLLRFDATDQRMYLTDELGTPGSGAVCVTLEPDTSTLCRVYPRCYDPDGNCYTEAAGDPGSGPVEITVTGDGCVTSTITLTGPLTGPTVENLTTGDAIRYDGSIGAGEAPVIIDTATGTATQDGAPRTDLISGDLRMTFAPGINEIRLRSFSTGDTGSAEVCWHPWVDWA